MGENKVEELWNPYRDLLSTVNKFIATDIQDDAAYNELETVLRRNKKCFMALLKNLSKNPKSREELKKAMDEGIAVRGVGHQVLSKELYQETLILSDMFDMNEYVALDLLCTAQIEMSFYPGVPRGLVAVLLYYDGRKCLVSALRTLIQARSGVMWSIELPESTQVYIDGYFEELVENGLFGRLFELLGSLDLSKEMDMLQGNLALGGPKHRKQVFELFKSIKLLLAECIFLWASQSGLNKANTLMLIKYLKEAKLEEEASGKLDSVTLYLLMALLQATDVSILNAREDGEELVQKLPIFSEENYIQTIIEELKPTSQVTWVCEGLYSVALFGLAVSLSSLKLIPQGQQLQNAIEYEDEFADRAIMLKVFEFMTHVMMENDLVYTEEIIQRRLHFLFCDFIVQMYPKVKELRIKADETSRTIQAYCNEGLELPTNLPRYFENMLLAIAKLYEKDLHGMHLMMDYWCQSDGQQTPSHYRTQTRSVSLYKFIQLAGDMLPPSLFVNYLKMLTSLSNSQPAARNCFNMLKQPSNLNNISWDHFFMSFNQYYQNLRQEVPSGNETVYRHSRIYHKGITPQEIEGLQAVLLLIKKVAELDEFSRLALCEHPAWAPLGVMLGLVSCSIPIPLKANLLLALSALCKSTEIAGLMWNNLEAAQILVTIPSRSSFQPRGIQSELDEVESRLEEYPLTKAFLMLLDVLTDNGIPRTLGAGPRQPGFDPYLTFILQSVFLKFNSRPYKNPAEKWEIAALCLKLFSKFLTQYEPDGTDFPTNVKQNEFNSPPGFHLMLQLLSRSELFMAILYIIHEGNRFFDMCVSFTGEKALNDSTFYALNIIERCLQLQTKFLHLLTSSNCPALLVTMNKLIISINPRSGRPDHVLNIMKYMGYQDVAPRQCLVAARIVTLLTASPPTHSQIMNILLSSNDVDKVIRTGFVECLDITDEEENEYIIITKKAIFKLLDQCLTHNSPNLSHFLFGFDLQKQISKTVFQLPGILNFPRTCIHSLISMLRQSIYGIYDHDASLIEGAYELLYSLCSNGKTAEPVLRLLRQQPNFLRDSVKYCYRNYNIDIHHLNQLSWMLKILAIELRLTGNTKQIVHLKQLMLLLIGLPVEQKFIADSFSILQKPASDAPDDCSLTIEQLKHNNFLVKLLTEFNVETPEIVIPQWGMFEYSSLKTYLDACQTDSTPKLIDIKKLHKSLLEELAGPQCPTAPLQRLAMLDEIQKVLLHALNVNNSRNAAACKVKFIDAWRQVAEVLVVYLRTEIITPKEQVLLHIHMLESVLQKAVKTTLPLPMASFLSGTVLLILDSLRKSHLDEVRQLKSLSKDSVGKTIVEFNISSMKNILNHIVEWIITCDVASQRIRINLYGALAIFLQLISITDHHPETSVDESMYVSRLDSTKFRIRDEISTIYIQSNTFEKHGEKLIESLCYDSAGGQEICKMLAMSCFSLLINLNANPNWITYLSSRGYLKHVIESVLNSDADLRSVLEPVPENIRNLYMYDAKLSFLSRLASTKFGSELLLEHRLLCALANMKVYDLHPEVTKYSEITETTFITSVENRYLQIWQPALQICNAILTSMGTDNQAVTNQIMTFLFSHLDVVELVLRSGGPSLSVESLQELSLLTSVIARTANNSMLVTLDSAPLPQDLQSYLFRIQKLMLALIPKFMLNDGIVRQLLCETTQSEQTSSYQTSDRLSLAIEIITNLLLYARNIVENNGIQHEGVGVIFQPNLIDTIKTYKNLDSSPPIGIIIQNLINTVNYYHKEKGTLNFLNRKVSEIPELGTVDLKDYTMQASGDVSLMREEALEFMSHKLKMKRHDIEHCLMIIEHSMYIVWAHLDYYMLKAIPKSHFGNNIFDTSMSTCSEVMWKVNTDDISCLKQGLVSVFNDSFCRQMIETSQGRSEADVGFLEVLLRKTKRLIQFVPVK